MQWASFYLVLVFTFLDRYALVLVPFYRQGLPQNAQVWTVRQNIALPHTQDTFYWCHIEKIPKWQRKHHYIGVSFGW